MKKIVIVSILVLAVAASAFAVTFTGPNRDVKYFKGISGSFNLAGTGTSKLAYTVNLKGSFGFAPDNKQLAGIKIGVGFTNKKYLSEDGDDFDPIEIISAFLPDVDINKIASALGFDASSMTSEFNYSITPFYRYKVMDVSFIPGLNLWLEAKGVFQQNFAFTGSSLSSPSTKISLRVHPVIAYDINEKMSISTAVEVLALYGQCNIATNGTVKYSAGLQGFNLKTVTEGLVNFTIITKF